MLAQYRAVQGAGERDRLGQTAEQLACWRLAPQWP